MDLNITRLHQRNMLCCEECCGVPIFANSTTAQCKHCECQVPLRINPRLIGTLTDETGSIASGKLTWSPCAWEQLLGRTAEQLVCEKVDVLRYLEYRMLFLRIAMMFGWAGSEGLSGGRLVVLGVR
ncbi:hypothetical protein MMC14_001467 [Varicellaria rhodocarpa]|nr:hypothetical protein [Varicellaria rhodocarpa]